MMAEIIDVDRIIRRKPDEVPEPSQEEEEVQGLVSRIGSAGLSALGAFGNLISLPMSSVADILAGEDPTDQWLTPFSGENRSSGRDVLAKWNILSENKETGWVPLEDPKEFLQDSAGFAFEFAIDPISWVTGAFNAASKAAKAADSASKVSRAAGTAKAAGKAGKLGYIRRGAEKFGDVFDVLDPGQHLGRAGYRFATENDVARELIQRTRQKASSGVRKASEFASPVVSRVSPYISQTSDVLKRRLSQAFDYQVKDAVTAPVQEATRKSEELVEKLGTEFGEAFIPVVEEILSARDNLSGIYPDEWTNGVLRTFTDAMEASSPEELEEVMRGLPDTLRKPISGMKAFQESLLRSARSEGIRVGRLNDKINEYLHRQMSDYVYNKLSEADPMMETRGTTRANQVSRKEHQGHRTQLFRDGRKNAFDDVTADPELHGILDEAYKAKEVYGDTEKYDNLMAEATERIKEVANGKILRDMELMGSDSTFTMKKVMPDGSEDIIEIPVNTVLDMPRDTQLLVGDTVQWQSPLPSGDLPRPGVVEKLAFRNGRWEAKLKGVDADIPADELMFWDEGRGTAVPEHPNRFVVEETVPVLDDSGKTVLDDVGRPLKEKITATYSHVLGDRYRALAEHVYNRPIYLEAGGVFAGPVQSMLSGFRAALTSIQNARVINETIGNGMKTGIIRPPSLARGKRMTLKDLFDAGEFSVMDKWKSYDKLMDSEEFQNFVSENGLEEIFELTEDMSFNDPAAVENLLDSMEIDPDVARDLLRSVAPMSNAETFGLRGDLANALQSFTSLFKAGVLTHPARYNRDFISGQVQNMMHGIFSGRSFRNMFNVLFRRGDMDLLTIPEVKRYLRKRGLPEDGKGAVQAVREMYEARRMHSGNLYFDLDNASGSLMNSVSMDQVERSLLGRHESPKELAKDIGREAIGAKEGTSRWKFWDVAGFNRRKETKFGLARAGELWGKYTDDANRLVGFIEGMRQGLSADEAMKIVNRVQINYDPRTFTPSERWLKRFFPFYSYYTREAAYLTREMMTNPNGRLGKLIRLQSKADTPEQEGQYVPEHVREKMAIPLGRSNDGGQNYLTSLGLMHEDVLADIFGGLMSPQRAMRNLISRSNPLIKGVAEYGLGRSSFQGGPLGGRDIVDMDPTLGRILTQLGLREPSQSGRAKPFISRGFEYAFSNSPFSRAGSSIKTMLDKRKSIPERILNLTTGMRIHTVSPEQSRGALRSLGDAIARDAGARSFSTFIVNDDLIDSVDDPETKEVLRAIKRRRELWNQERRRMIRRKKKESN